MRMVAVVVLSLSCLGAGCRDVAAPERRLEPSQQVVISGDSVRLTYICGNTFRLRNANPDYVEVRWDIFRTADSGRLVLPARPANAAFSQVFVTAAVRGTMRVFVNGRLEETKANGGLPACETAGQETPWPDSSLITPRMRASTLLSLGSGANQVVISRTEFRAVFHDSVSDISRQDFVRSHRGVVLANLGRVRGILVVFPDPGNDTAAVFALRRSLRSDPRIKALVSRSSTGITIDARYPVDNGEWLTPARLESDARLWSHRATRLPQAWGCLNSGSDLATPTVSIFEGWSAELHPDLSGAVRSRNLPDFGDQPIQSSDTVAYANHAAALTGLVAAEGDNGIGLAGVLWRPDLHLFRIAASSATIPTQEDFFKLFRDAVTSSAHAVVVASDRKLAVGVLESAEILDVRTIAELEVGLAIIESELSGRRTMVVVSAGNDGFVGQASDYAVSVNAQILHSALFSLRRRPEFASRIVVVAGSDEDRRLWRESNYVISATDIAAPADRIPVLAAASGGSVGIAPRPQSGTSYAAPIVAATLAAMAAAVPSLTPAELKEILIAGTNVADTRPDGTFGRMPDISSGNAAVTGLRELDVYGALVALRRRVPTAPLCGDRLSVRQGPSSWRIEMAPDSGAPRSLELPPFFFPQETTTGGWGSVAQGGRLL